MDKRLVAVGVAIGLVVLVVGINFLFNKEKTTGNVCQDFILRVQEGKADASYELLTERAKGETPLSDWEKQVNSLKVAYISGTMTLKTSEKATNADSTIPQTREIYTIKSGGSSYLATCVISEGQVDGFNSKPVN